MPDLSSWPDADALLDEALGLPVSERKAFVRARTPDSDFQAALLRVLDEATASDGFLDAEGGTGAALFEDWRQSSSTEEPGLAAGDAIGVYKVVSWIGRGGMGEVYRAHDASLSRDVALKVLPADLADDSTRLARLRREARLLAALNHPNVAGIYAVVEDEHRLALVLELVEGPTLAERLKAGPLPVPAALDVARQIAEAIEAAQQKGVVHRDLKPANIKLTAAGVVKVLDFGIAKAVSEDGDGVDPALTRTGARGPLGTASYMSPEQARGEAVDHRTDVWAFGCVLYELLTGSRTFPGESIAEVLGRVLEREPDFTRLPAGLPAPVDRLLRRTLEKNRRRRLGYIGDALLEIDDARTILAGGSRDREPAPRRSSREWVLPAAGALALSALVGGAVWTYRTPPPAPPPMELAVPVPADQTVVVGQLTALEVSGDGQTIVYRARQGPVMRLFVRSLTGGSPTVIPGTDDVAGHALSPDGRSVVFGRGGLLYRVVLAGGAPVSLGPLPGGSDLSWGSPDTIVASGGPGGSLRRIPAAGGEAVPFTTVDAARGHLAHGTPELLPDGRTVLLTVLGRDGVHVGMTTLDGGDVSILAPGRQPRLLPSGHLIFARGRSLWVASLDVETRRLTSDPVQVLDGVERSSLNAHVHFTVADDGTLFYIPWRERTGLTKLAWHDRQGQELEVVRESPGLARFSLSPDGSRVALAVADGDERDIWVLDRSRGTTARLTFDPVPDSQPVWSPDGSLIAFRSDRDGGGVFLRRADGAAEPQRLTRAGEGYHIPYDFTPDGRRVLFTEFRDYADQDILAVDLDSHEVVPLLTDTFAEVHPALSPDGRWLLYQSDETGRFEVYLRPFPDVLRARWRVSIDGGQSPTWRSDGREIFFASGAVLMAASFQDGQPPRVGRPAALFSTGSTERLGPQFDVSDDGQRLLVLSPVPSDPVADRPEVRVIQRWGAALVGRSPGS